MLLVSELLQLPSVHYLIASVPSIHPSIHPTVLLGAGVDNNCQWARGRLHPELVAGFITGLT